MGKVKEDIKEAEVSAAMDVIIAKNIFTSTGGDSAKLDYKNSTEMKVK